MIETPHNFAAGLHDRFLDGELNADGARLLAEHRAACPACDRQFARMERIVETLVTLERPLPSAGFVERVMADVRPAAAPVWARWRLDTAWRRAAAVVLLLAGAVAVLAGASLLTPILGDAGSLGLIFRGPGFLAEAVVALVTTLRPFSALTELVSTMIGALLAAADRPELLWALTASALLSVLALLQLSKLLAAPERRRPSHV